MLRLTRRVGSVDVSAVIRILDSTDGSPETGVVAATAGLALEYRREGEASTAITEADLAALTTAHTDGGIKHIGNGYYRVDLPDAAVASGAAGVLLHGTVTGMQVVGCYVQLEPGPADLLAVEGSLLSGAGPFPVLGIKLRGTAQAGAASTITLSAGASATTDYYKGDTVLITSGTGAGQTATVTAYNGTTKVATISPSWVVATPDATSVFVVLHGLSGLTQSELVTAVADGVWDEPSTDHQAAGSTGRLMHVDLASIAASNETYPKGVAIPGFTFAMTLTADGLPATGKTVAAQISKDGGAFVAVAGAVTEIGSTHGVYKVDLSASEMSADEVFLAFTATGCFPRRIKIRAGK